jgi:predicted ATPase
VPLSLRVGVNTGEVVVRSIRKDDLQTDYVPVGHSTNIAARLETLAAPGSIVVSAPTYKLTEGYFECKALGETPIKGVSESLPIYEVLGVGPLRTKLQVAARRGLARFVGRRSELEHLRHALDLATSGHGQVVGVIGEPGVGKSRLFYEFKCTVPRGCLVLETFSVSHGKAYPYLPLIDLLKNYFQLGLQDDERQRREKITGKVLTLDRSLEDILPYLFFLLGIAEPTSPLQQMDPQIRRRRTLDAIKRLLVRESLNQPLIIIFEDLHWLDAETQAFLQLLSEAIPTTRMLLLVNYRPEYQHTWSGKTFFSQLRLDPLGKEQAEEMLMALLDETPSPLPRGERDRERVKADNFQVLKQFILDKTEGNPFFMEEIVQALREQGLLNVGASLPTDLHIPTTVQGVLAARIDRLPPNEKALLQTLAVIGKEFSFNLLKQVVGQSEDDLLRQLSRLQTSEFIYERPAFPNVEYTFKHALTQEVAYNSLLVERRKVVHERAARAIEEVYRSKLDDRYSELAHHYTRSGNTQKAVEYLHRAGQQAAQRSANAEAISYLTSALELLKTLPDTPERAQQELTLHVTLGMPLLVTRSVSSPEVKATLARARELCQQLGETRQLFPVLYGLWTFHLVRGEFLAARELGEQLLGLAQREQDPALLMEPYWALGVTLFYLGELGGAQAHLAQGLTLYDSQRYHSHEFIYAIEPGVYGLCYAALVLWQLGYPDQALQKSEAACTLAQERSHPFSLAAARFLAAMTHQFRRERPLTQEWAEAAITLAREHGFAEWVGPGAILQGWALAEQGQVEEGIAQMRQGLATCQALGAGILKSYYLVLLAEAYGKAGQAEEGLAALAEALTVVDKTGERFSEAELYRLRGELTLAQSSVQGLASSVQKEAEECFLKAIEVARHQQAKSLELRAMMSLARLWQQQGKREESHQMLAAIYGWFTEGFDTKDLQEAKALLDSLRSSVTEGTG